MCCSQRYNFKLGACYIWGTPGLGTGSDIILNLYINGIASDVSSTLRLFTDSILYKEIKSAADQRVLQEDLQKVFKWADQQQMCLNASKCKFLQITRKKAPLSHIYSVDGQDISESKRHKYLGVTINKQLDWKDHVQKITASARSTLGVLRRNMSSCSQEVKKRAYCALLLLLLSYKFNTPSGEKRTGGQCVCVHADSIIGNAA